MAEPLTTPGTTTPGPYQQAMGVAATMLRPPPRLPGGAAEQYMKAYTAAQEALADELLNTSDPASQARAQRMAGAYNEYLGQYAAVFVPTLIRNVRAHGPLTPEAYLTVTQAENAKYWMHFNGQAIVDEYRGIKTMPMMVAQGGEPVQYAFEKLGAKMRGQSLTTLLFYDEKKAKVENSAMAGIRWGGIAGAAAGFFAGGALGLEGIWGWLASAVMAVGGAFGGNLIEGFIRGDAAKTPAPAPRLPARGTRRLRTGLDSGPDLTPTGLGMAEPEPGMEGLDGAVREARISPLVRLDETDSGSSRPPVHGIPSAKPPHRPASTPTP